MIANSINKTGMNLNILNKFKSNQLFPRSGFLTGMGSVFNISGNYFERNCSKSNKETDARAIASDWGMVGQDLQQVLDTESSKEKSVTLNHCTKEN